MEPEAAGDAAQPPAALVKSKSKGGKRRRIVYPAEDLATARTDEALLHSYLTMTTADFDAAIKRTPRKLKNVFSLFGIAPPEGLPKNATLTLNKLRDIFFTYQGVLVWDGKIFMENLLVGKLACRVCVGEGATAGVFECCNSSVARHLEKQTHIKRVHTLQTQKQPHVEQLDLHHVGFVPPVDLGEAKRLARVLAIGHLVAGGDGAAGIPPSAVSSVLSSDMLVALGELQSGIDSGTGIRESILPEMAALIHARIKELVSGIDLAFVVDGGSSHLALHSKVIAVLASSPALPFDLLLKAQVLSVHEDSKILANIIDEVRIDYVISSRCLKYLSADGAEVNHKTVKELNVMPDRDYEIAFAVCLPHGLARVLMAFFAVFERTYGIGSFLKKFRGFTNSGGGSGKLRQLAEMGLSLSELDVCDTRWPSYSECTVALGGLQKPLALKRARALLTALVADGEDIDGSAAAALAETDVRRPRWDIIYEFVESYEVKALEKADKRRKKESVTVDVISSVGTRAELLKWLSSVDNFAGVQSLAVILGGGLSGESVSTVFAVTQGSPEWSRTFKQRGLQAVDASGKPVVKTAISATQSLVAMVKSLNDVDTRALLKHDVRKALDGQCERVRAAAEASNEGLLPTSPSYSIADVPIFQDNFAAASDAAVTAAMNVVQEACDALKHCKALPKLEATLAQLAIGCNFGLSTLIVLPDPVASVWEFFGVPSPLWTAQLLVKLRFGWAAHTATFHTIKSSAAMAPKEVFKYWSSLADCDETFEVAKYALWNLLRPMSSAAAERIFSYLTQMDDSRRRNMGKKALTLDLYIRGNWRVVNMLLAEYAQQRRDTQVLAASTAMSRRTMAAKASAAAATGAAAAAVGGAAAPA